MKTVSIITPAFNAEKFLTDCVSSVQNLKTTDEFKIEHIVIDDGSADSTRQILEAMNYPNLKKVFLPHNQGAGKARNAGIEQSAGEYLFCLDADDVIFQNSIKYLFDEAQRLRADWVYGDFLRSNADLQYIIGDDYFGWAFDDIPDLLISVFSGEHFFQHNSLFSKKIFYEAGQYDDIMKVAHDFDLMARFLINGNLPKFLKGPLYIHRFHDQNLSKRHLGDGKLHREDSLKIFRKHEREIRMILNEEQIKKIENYLGINS